MKVINNELFIFGSRKLEVELLDNQMFVYFIYFFYFFNPQNWLRSGARIAPQASTDWCFYVYWLISFEYWLCDQNNNNNNNKNCITSGLRCVCVGGKSWWSSSLAAAPPACIKTSPTHLLCNTKRRREHYRRNWIWNWWFNPFISCFSCVIVVQNGPPRDRHDFKHGEDDTQKTERKSGQDHTKICLAIINHTGEQVTLSFLHSRLILLLLSSTKHVDLTLCWVLIRRRSHDCPCVCDCGRAAVLQNRHRWFLDPVEAGIRCQKSMWASSNGWCSR